MQMAVDPVCGMMTLVSLLRRGDQQESTGHAGTRNGIVSGASLISVSGTNMRDCHDSMNGENLEHWMLTETLPNLEEPPVIVMGIAPYQRVFLENPQIQSWRKDEIFLAAREGNSLCRKIF
jgi:hypothetical protein